MRVKVIGWSLKVAGAVITAGGGYLLHRETLKKIVKMISELAV